MGSHRRRESTCRERLLIIGASVRDNIMSYPATSSAWSVRKKRSSSRRVPKNEGCDLSKVCRFSSVISRVSFVSGEEPNGVHRNGAGALCSPTHAIWYSVKCGRLPRTSPMIVIKSSRFLIRGGRDFRPKSFLKEKSEEAGVSKSSLTKWGCMWSIRTRLATAGSLSCRQN